MARDPRYRDRYERNKRRLGRQRGAKVARVDIARKLAEAIWHVLTKKEPFAPAGLAMRLVAGRPSMGSDRRHDAPDARTLEAMLARELEVR